MSTLSKRHFWDWFTRHNHEYISLTKKPKKESAYLLNELNAHLRAYNKCFGFSLECRTNKTSILTITVHGKLKHFKKAEQLVAMAPVIPGWKIVALEDTRPIDFLLEQQVQETGIDPREFYFSLNADDPDDLVLTVYHPLCTGDNEGLLYQLASAAVYNLLGERSFATDIHWLEMANLSYANPDEIEKLEELPSCIGYRKSGIMVNSEGSLVIAG